MPPPSDILLLIFSYLEPHLTADDCDTRDLLSTELEPQLRDYCVNRATLASLCRVSKQCNALATTLLYGCVCILYEDDLRGFTRTVLESRKLRGLVKNLSLEFELWSIFEEPDPERQQMVPSMEQGQWDYERCLSEVLHVVGVDEMSADDLGVGGADLQVDEADLSEKLPEDVAGVLLFVLPGLRYLRIKLEPMSSPETYDVVGYWTCDLFLQSLRLAYHIRSRMPELPPLALAQMIPASLLHLEELVMCNPFERPGWVKSTWPPIVFNDVWEMRPFWGLPALKSLTLGRTMGGLNFPEHRLPSTVQHLTLLDTAIDPPELPRILEHFPSLRSMRYVLSDKFSLTDPGGPLVTRGMLDLSAIEETIRGCCPGLGEVSVALLGVSSKEATEQALLELEKAMNGD